MEVHCNFVLCRQNIWVDVDIRINAAIQNCVIILSQDKDKGLDDIKVDVKSPNETYTLGIDVTPYEAVDLIQNWLKEQGLY